MTSPIPGVDRNPGCGFLARRELDRLLDGELSGQQLEAFEAHLDTGCGDCLLLVADAEVFRAATELRDREREEFARLAPFLRRRLSRQRAAAAEPALRRRQLAALAAAVLFAVAGLALLRSPAPGGERFALPLPGGGSLRPEAMPFSAPPSLRGEADPGALWSEAGAAYVAGRYREAASRFGEIAARNPATPDPLLYEGISRLLGGEPALAAEALERAEAVASAADVPVGSILWYRALAALAVGDLDLARDALGRGSVVGGSYAARSRALFDRLPPAKDD